MKRTRRSFLRVAGLSVFALSSGITSLSGEARAAVAPGHYEQGQTDTKGFRRNAGPWLSIPVSSRPRSIISP